MKRYTIGLINGMILTASCFLFINAKMPNDEIITKRLRIVNDVGTTLIDLDKNFAGGGSLSVNDNKGNFRAVISGFGETGGLSITTEKFGEGVTIIGYSIDVLNKEGESAVNIKSNKDNLGVIKLMDRNGSYRELQ